MSNIREIEQDASQVGTVSELADIFESIASMRISKTKSKVTQSELFFAKLWQTYTSLRVNPKDRLTGTYGPQRDKENVYVVLTSEGGLSGDIDRQIVSTVLEHFDEKSTDLIVIGAHGANQFSQHNVPIKHYFRIPDIDRQVDVSPIVEQLLGYKNPTVWFERYVSLAVQEVGRIDLYSHVRALAEGNEVETTQIISPKDYLFEPNINTVVQYLEGVMMEIALSQVILESRLAQYASRFTAMSAAKKRARELQLRLHMAYSQARRAESDDRIKEIVGTMNALGMV